jgi:tetratricopeptide (TPR) repeat protein
MKRDAALVVVLIFGLGVVVLLSRWIDDHRAARDKDLDNEQLYIDGPTAKRMTFAFNGLAADLYWMRSLQYVGRKIVNYQDTHAGGFDLNNLSTLELRLLPSLLRVTTTLDPQFIPAYEYGAVILPDVSADEAVSLLNQGIAANPSSWRLHQHLGYIFWQQQNYEKAGEVYAAGSRLPGAPAWMSAMAARMKAEGGSRDAAREMYLHLGETSSDATVKDMVGHNLMRLDWLDDRDVIRYALRYYQNHSRDERCPSSWRGMFDEFPGTRLRFDPASGAPLDPSGMPYRLVNGGCDVDLNEKSKVPR